MPPVNFEIQSRHRDTSHGPSIPKYAKRPELWKVLDLPDSQIYARPFQAPYEQDKRLNAGSLDFGKRPPRQGHVVYDPRQRIEYSNDLVERGFKLSSTKRV